MNTLRSTTRLLLLLLFLFSLSLPALAQSDEAPTVVMVVRHAEKAAGPGSDPPLTEAGQQRAQALVEAASEAGVTAIYSSQFKRTQETVAPLAAHLGLTVTTAEISRANLETYPKQLAETILAEHRGETVVVVNHSNTVPLIVEALGGGPVDAISEEEYDHFFVVIIPLAGPTRTVRAQYGK